uniref:Methyltransferase type 11 n=1 Tax=Cyanothece sp. (strain PCC 7425 / ATCC 29141) TaxID=395961 RepID=B8HRB8_CYAP4
MAVRKDTLFEQFLAPIVRLLIDEPALQRFHESTDWVAVYDRFSRPDLSYPDYYRDQNYHGIAGGYLNPGAAVSYDPITQYVLFPQETLLRQTLVSKIQGQPRRMLDLGCGTGSTTLLLKQAFPQTEVIGLDLSPYMLFMGDRKATAAGLEIQFIQGDATQTGFPSASFDVVTATLLFHETPPEAAAKILREAFRLLTPGGQILILDGNQQTLRQTNWLTQVFEEPYIHAYADGSLDAWLARAGFQQVKTEDQWWINQISSGLKPLSLANLSTAEDEDLQFALA